MYWRVFPSNSTSSKMQAAHVIFLISAVTLGSCASVRQLTLPTVCEEILSLDFSNGFPEVTCTPTCSASDMETWSVGSVYKRLLTLRPFGLMVKVDYTKTGVLCSLVESKSDSALINSFVQESDVCQSLPGTTQTPVPTTELTFSVVPNNTHVSTGLSTNLTFSTIPHGTDSSITDITTEISVGTSVTDVTVEFSTTGVVNSTGTGITSATDQTTVSDQGTENTAISATSTEISDIETDIVPTSSSIVSHSESTPGTENTATGTAITSLTEASTTGTVQKTSLLTSTTGMVSFSIETNTPPITGTGTESLATETGITSTITSDTGSTTSTGRTSIGIPDTTTTGSGIDTTVFSTGVITLSTTKSTPRVEEKSTTVSSPVSESSTLPATATGETGLSSTSVGFSSATPSDTGTTTTEVTVSSPVPESSISQATGTASHTITGGTGSTPTSVGISTTTPSETGTTSSESPELISTTEGTGLSSSVAISTATPSETETAPTEVSELISTAFSPVPESSTPPATGTASHTITGGTGSTPTSVGISTTTPSETGTTLSESPELISTTTLPRETTEGEESTIVDCANPGASLAQDNPTTTTSTTTTTTTTTTTPLAPVMVCPSEYVRYADSCYHISTTKGTWDSGDSYCRNKGGLYVTITSEGENNFVKSLLTESAWIGYNDKVKESEFLWTSGERNSLYSNFAKGEPNNGSLFGSNEDCVEMRKSLSYLWNDEGCGSRNIFACETGLVVQQAK